MTETLMTETLFKPQYKQTNKSNLVNQLTSILIECEIGFFPVWDIFSIAAFKNGMKYLKKVNKGLKSS